MGIRSLGYLRFGATDLDAWYRFLGEGLDMDVVRDDPDVVRARMDDRFARLFVAPAEVDRLDVVGWEVAGRRELEGLAETLEQSGVAVEEATASELAERRVEAMVHVSDPGGTRLELYVGPALDHRPLAPRAGTRFVTDGLGLGHVVLPAPEMDESMAFYEGLLGFQHRDSMRIPAAAFPGRDPEKGDAWIRFLGCNARHHSLALFESAIPSGIVHFMVEVAELDDVGRGLDRCRSLEVPLSATLGRHTNDHMVSFYVGTPGGFDVEYGTAGRLVDPVSWVATEITEVSFWGHRFQHGV